jgi:hypothetical protein
MTPGAAARMEDRTLSDNGCSLTLWGIVHQGESGRQTFGWRVADALPSAARQLRHYLVPGDIIGHKKHERVVNKIGRFFNDAFSSLAGGSQNDFNRFFADFLGYLFLIGQQLARIGAFSRIFFAIQQYLVKLINFCTHLFIH